MATEFEIKAGSTYRDAEGLEVTVDRTTDHTVWYSGEATGHCRKTTFQRDFSWVRDGKQDSPFIVELNKLIADEGESHHFRHVELACFLRRSRVGAWCGYVALPPSRLLKRLVKYGRMQLPLRERKPVFSTRVMRRVPYDHRLLRGIEVHGGLTFFGKLYSLKGGRGDRRTVLGFDCAHASDFIPGYGSRIEQPFAAYRTKEFVINETKRLAEQIRALINQMDASETSTSPCN